MGTRLNEKLQFDLLDSTYHQQHQTSSHYKTYDGSRKLCTQRELVAKIPRTTAFTSSGS